MRILTLDIGSSSVKAGMWNGNSITRQSRVPFPTTFDGPRVEIRAELLLKALVRAGREALDGVASIDAISYCTFSSGILITDLKNKPLTPIITHADRRSSATALDLVKRRPKTWWLTRTANLPYAGGIGTSTLAWLRQNEPSVFSKPYRVCQVSSFVGNFLKGGTGLMDPSQAVFLGLWDIRHNQWSKEICDLIGISNDALPESHWANGLLGGSTRALSKLWGIHQGTFVIGGFVDTSAAVIQTPMKPGQLSHNAGSTDVLALCVDRPHPAEGILSRPVGISGTAKIDKPIHTMPWLAVRTIASAGSAIDWTRKTLFPELSPARWKKTVGTACQHVAQSDPPEAGVQCHPTFVGERASLVQPDGASFSGIRLGTDRAQLLQAVIRALAAESAHNYNLLAAIHKPQKNVYLMGGATDLGDAMHAAWPGRHTLTHLNGDSLRGLVLLAQRTCS